MQKLYTVLLALLFASNAFAQCAMATANNSYGVYCDASGDIDVQAAQYCEKSGGHNCTVIAHFSNSCWAIAKDRALGVSAAAYGHSTLDEAKLASINKCLTQGGKNCSNTANVGCEGPTQFNSAQPSSTKSQEAPVSTTSAINCDRIEGWWSRMQCRGEQSRKREEQAKLDTYRSKCTGLGFKLGTNEFAQCTLQLLAQENANDQAEQQRQVERLKPPPMVDLTPSVINNGPSTPAYDLNPKMRRPMCSRNINGTPVLMPCTFD